MRVGKTQHKKARKHQADVWRWLFTPAPGERPIISNDLLYHSFLETKRKYLEERGNEEAFAGLLGEPSNTEAFLRLSLPVSLPCSRGKNRWLARHYFRYLGY